MDRSTLCSLLKQIRSPPDRVVVVMVYDKLLGALQARLLSNATIIFNTQLRSQPGQHCMTMV